MINPPGFEFLSHHLAQGTHACIGDIRDLKHLRVQFVSGSHTADERYIQPQGQFCQGQLRSDRIYGIYDIIRPFLKQCFQIIRKHKHLICFYPDLRIDISDPLFHDFCLIYSDSTVIGNGLPVNIGK